MTIPVIHLRDIDRKRLASLKERTESDVHSRDIWFIHTVLAQCFLPYRDPKTERWHRTNGEFSILLTAGALEDGKASEGFRVIGLPFGAKPRLFQSYICTQAVKLQSPVVPVERSMTAMMGELGYEAKGGKRGTIASFKDQITRFARCGFTLVGPGPRNALRTYVDATPIKTFDVWFPPHPDQETLWPSEIVLTDEYFHSLKDHAVPFDFRALQAIQNKPRSQDIYLWMTQRLCRINHRKPLLMRWTDLYAAFGGQSSRKKFKQNFPADLAAARASYPAARLEDHKDGFLFYASPTPVPKTRAAVKKQGERQSYSR